LAVLKERSWEKDERPNLLGIKIVDKSIFKNGSTVPLKIAPFFAEANNGYMPERGEKIEIRLLIGDSEYEADLKNINRTGVKSDTFQIRYDGNVELKALLQKVFTVSYEAFSGLEIQLEDDETKESNNIVGETMEFYKTDTPMKYQVILKSVANDEKVGVKMETQEKNLILYGPPGTGKTYSVIDEALSIIDKEKYQDLIGNAAKRQEAQAAFQQLREQKRIGFCTFHQSFGYEEFIEGLRSGEKVGQFIPQNGVFKEICEAAVSSLESPAAAYHFTEDTNFFKMSVGSTHDDEGQEIYQYCLEQNMVALGWGGDVDYSTKNTEEKIREAYLAQYPQDSKFGSAAIIRLKVWMQKGDIILVSAGNRKVRAIARVVGDYEYIPDTPIRYSHFRKVEWLLKDVNIPVQQLLRDKAFSQQTIYLFDQKDLLINNLQDLLSGKRMQEKPENYVLIIDEINRGNISKIFGELITLIEPDKRLGTENEIQVTLPYSGESFGVPQNVYIIGTMNTADRSIALMDTALRRRFCFLERMPQYDLLPENVEGVRLRDMLQIMNDRIEYLYDRDHVLGHAYFLGKNTLEQLGEVMIRRVIPLLQEYFYEDWEKIALVLGGAGKNAEEGAAEYLLWKENLDPTKLFKQRQDLNENEAKVRYSVVEKPTLAALQRIYQW